MNQSGKLSEEDFDAYEMNDSMKVIEEAKDMLIGGTKESSKKEPKGKDSKQSTMKGSKKKTAKNSPSKAGTGKGKKVMEMVKTRHD